MTMLVLQFTTQTSLQPDLTSCIAAFKFGHTLRALLTRPMPPAAFWGRWVNGLNVMEAFLYTWILALQASFCNVWVGKQLCGSLVWATTTVPALSCPAPHSVLVCLHRLVSLTDMHCRIRERAC